MRRGGEENLSHGHEGEMVAPDARPSELVAEIIPGLVVGKVPEDGAIGELPVLVGLKEDEENDEGGG